MGTAARRRDNRWVSRAASIAVLSCLAIIGMPAPVAASQTYGDALGSHSMVYLNSTSAQHEAVFRATSQVGLRYLRMDFAVGLVF